MVGESFLSHTRLVSRHAARPRVALAQVKRLVERAGGTFRVHRQLFGPHANTLVAVSEYKDWNGFAKLRSDSEFQQLVDRIRSSANPAADIVGGELYEELPV